jgi:hypothetical protein
LPLAAALMAIDYTPRRAVRGQVLLADAPPVRGSHGAYQQIQ